MKQYLISGIPASSGGVGYLMYLLEKIANKNNYEVICPTHSNKSLKQMYSNPFKILKEVYTRYRSRIIFKQKIKELSNSEVILIHPQTIGFGRFLSLIENNTIVKWYVVDNSFFCIKSYNTLDGKECLNCLKDLSKCDSKCKPFPRNYGKRENLECLNVLKKYASKILFYVQNNMQEKLIKEFYGENISTSIIGLKTDELGMSENVKNSKKYDIVYHGANSEAKGIEYTIEVAKYLKEYTVFIPEKEKKLKYRGVLPSNIVCQSLSWNTGLKELVMNAKLVLNPSIWSAPVEGALIKSIYYNGNVAVPKTQYGFINDISNDAILKLTTNIEESANIISEFMISNSDYRKKSHTWLEEFLEKKCQLDSLFCNNVK